jgi:hypothetical protein
MEGNGVGRAPFSAEFQTAVRAELDSMLRAPIFTQSNRCKRFLSHVVHQTLAGEAGGLKERTIGISVFERKIDYDTGDDSIVRVTANEVRKRLGQYYRETSDIHLIQIELPRGSYVPEFRIQPLRQAERSVEVGPSDQAQVEPRLPSSLKVEQRSIAIAGSLDASARREQIAVVNAPPRSKVRNRVVYSVFLISLAAAAVALGTWKDKAAKRPPDLWGAFLHADVPVLVCIDTHNLQTTEQQQSDGQTFVDLILRRQVISLDDAAILSTMASELGRKGIPFRVVGADQTSLAELRRQPVILIGAIDNKWTLRLTQNLRYRLEVANPPGSDSGKEPIASIVDSESSTNTPWVEDLSVPFTAWKSDYAIVARMDDVTTGVPVLIEAGLGNDGTVAASEWITSGAITEALANEPSCRGRKNFESVIETQIIDTKSGPPHVLRLSCW